VSLDRRRFLRNAGAMAAAAALPVREASAGAKAPPRRFETPADLARYTRLSRLAQPLVMAHRGGYKPHVPGYPENSLVSARRVLATGPAMIEVDIRRTRDGVMVPLHDATLDRETTGSGPVDAIRFADFRKLQRRDATGAATEVPTESLADFLDWSADGALLWLDTKDIDPVELVALIRDRRAEARVIVSAYGRAALEAYQAETEALVHFVPLIPAQGLATLADVNAAGLDDARMIGFAGYYVPDVAATQAMRERDIPALLGLDRGDGRLRADQLDPLLYRRAVETGFPMLNTDHYAEVLAILGISGWA
jgi:glycerophosphoryl diester phosphodiesterase